MAIVEFTIPEFYGAPVQQLICIWRLHLGCPHSEKNSVRSRCCFAQCAKASLIARFPKDAVAHAMHGGSLWHSESSNGHRRLFKSDRVGREVHRCSHETRAGFAECGESAWLTKTLSGSDCA